MKNLHRSIQNGLELKELKSSNFYGEKESHNKKKLEFKELDHLNQKELVSAMETKKEL